jgi:hypothetical protein
LLARAAEETLVAGSGVQGDNAVAKDQGRHALSYTDDGSSELVTKETVYSEHLGVITAAIDFEVGSAGEGGANAQDKLSRASDRHRNAFDAQVFFAAKHGCCHLFGHHPIFSFFRRYRCMNLVVEKIAIR